MDYEQKYKNALENAKGIINYYKEHNRGDEAAIEDLEEIFPELKESDERIREEIIKFIKKRDRSGCDYDYDKWIAWIEKQKTMDKDIIFRPLAGTDIIVAAKQALEKIEIGKKVILAFNGAYIPVNGKTVAEICNEYFAWTEKQGEQKVPINDFKAKNWYVSEVDGKIHDMTYNPADKIEPKFKVRDWIINDQGSAFQIAYIDEENCRYVFEIGGYTKEEMNYENIAFANNHYRKWTIEDAKDGDVLYSLDSKQPFVFKHRKPNEQAVVYCGINTYGKFFIGNTKDCIITTDKYIPATKEQRDTLFRAMNEAGHQWDGEKVVKNGAYYKTLFKNQGIESTDKKANLSLKVKVSMMADEILALKEKLLALEKLAKDSEIRIDALECGGKPFQCPDKAGDNVTLEDMRK